jgi:ferric-dicitrate binding protein FerR (iron transport regulator)
MEALRAAWEEGAQPKVGGIGSWNTDHLWNTIASRIAEDEHPPLRLVQFKQVSRVPRFRITHSWNVAGWATAAACVVLFIGIAVGENVARDRARRAPPAREAMREYRTDRGQRASVTLPDGSAFQLGPLSVLRVSSGYGAPERVVELEGDGYFNVTHDAAHPFSVRTARTTIHDIGTRFVVRARSTEQRVEVAVADGEVSIEPLRDHAAISETMPATRAPRALMVTAGQAALVDERGVATLMSHAAIASRFAWTRGEFVFDHVLVPNVLAELSRWYGDTFVLADKSLDSVRLTTVLRGETLLEALVVLETALDVDTRVSGDTVTLTRHTKTEK